MWGKNKKENWILAKKNKGAGQKHRGACQDISLFSLRITNLS